jgi:hypothetical protein
MVDKAQIVEFLTKGFSHVQVAQICGCSISYISQVASDEAESIAVSRAMVTIQKQAIDSSYNALEEALLERLTVCLPFETNTTVLLKALATVNGAKRRSEGESAGNAPNTVVNQAILVMPERFVRQQDSAAEIVVNGNNEIVEVGGRPLLSASSQSINGMLNNQILERRAAQENMKQQFASVARGPTAEDF